MCSILWIICISWNLITTYWQVNEASNMFNKSNTAVCFLVLWSSSEMSELYLLGQEGLVTVRAVNRYHWILSVVDVFHSIACAFCMARKNVVAIQADKIWHIFHYLYLAPSPQGTQSVVICKHSAPYYPMTYLTTSHNTYTFLQTEVLRKLFTISH